MKTEPEIATARHEFLLAHAEEQALLCEYRERGLDVRIAERVQDEAAITAAKEAQRAANVEWWAAYKDRKVKALAFAEALDLTEEHVKSLAAAF